MAPRTASEGARFIEGIDLSRCNISGSNYMPGCEPGTFDHNQERVLGKAYEEAGQMDADNLATKFDINDFRLVDRARAWLLDSVLENKPELYELGSNVRDRLT